MKGLGSCLAQDRYFKARDWPGIDFLGLDPSLEIVSYRLKRSGPKITSKLLSSNVRFWALFQCLVESTHASELLGGKKGFEECLVDFQNKVYGRDPNITATNKPENASNVYFTFV